MCMCCHGKPQWNSLAENQENACTTKGIKAFQIDISPSSHDKAKNIYNFKSKYWNKVMFIYGCSVTGVAAASCGLTPVPPPMAPVYVYTIVTIANSGLSSYVDGWVDKIAKSLKQDKSIFWCT
jgi:hypothetical protein